MIIKIEGEDLALLRSLLREEVGPYSLRIEPRSDGVTPVGGAAFKVNQLTWTPTLGYIEEQ